jgi:hypothetical protein
VTVNDEQLEREIQVIREILQVRLRRYNRELHELERDLRELKILQRKRKAAETPVSSEVPMTEGTVP